jgi:hypothetical protein
VEIDDALKFIKGPTNNATGLKVVEHCRVTKGLLWGHLARVVPFDCPSSKEKVALSHPTGGFSIPILLLLLFFAVNRLLK